MEEVSFDDMFGELEKVIASNLSGTFMILVNSVAIYTTRNDYKAVNQNVKQVAILCYRTIGAE